MKLKEYLDNNGVTIKELANYCGVSYPQAYGVVRGYLNPSAPVAYQIELFTKGEVKVKDVRKCTSKCAHNCPCSQK